MKLTIPIPWYEWNQLSSRPYNIEPSVVPKYIDELLSAIVVPRSDGTNSLMMEFRDASDAPPVNSQKKMQIIAIGRLNERYGSTRSEIDISIKSSGTMSMP